MSELNTKRFANLQNEFHEERIVIVGAGIVGSAVASYLSERSEAQLILIDRSLDILLGSTGHAPGFVGQLNQDRVLTALAKESVSAYTRLPGAFETTGALEIASSEDAARILNQRLKLALNAGLPAQMVDARQAASLAPSFVRETRTTAALHFLSDGIAQASCITSAFREEAKNRGVITIEADVMRIDQQQGAVSGVETSLGRLSCTSIVLATGIWTSSLLSGLSHNLPIVPVAHPYVRGPHRMMRPSQSPFVRWPEAHIYARDHGEFDGLGSYDHLPVSVQDLGQSAIGEWPKMFDQILQSAYSILPDSKLFEGGKPFNGIFSMTPDNLPFVGAIDGFRGLWVGSAIWVTHAAACARVLADLMTGKTVDVALSKPLQPNRFDGQNEIVLRDESLRRYNDIYRSGKGSD
ncbi:hypothetical protein MMC24_006539 [Lignoscripta atroalba]|nr:hypothetical protein [Lignoscripta atroalba]